MVPPSILRGCLTMCNWRFSLGGVPNCLHVYVEAAASHVVACSWGDLARLNMCVFLPSKSMV